MPLAIAKADTQTMRAVRCAALLALLALASSPLAAGGVYKWTDADGKVHFSDKAPPDATAEEVATHAGQADAHTAKRMQRIQRQADRNLKAREKEEQAELKDMQEAEKIAAHCEKARKELKLLETSTRRQFINDQGEREFVGEERRQDWMNAARAELTKHCK